MKAIQGFHGEVDRSRIVIALITTDEAEEVATDAESLFLHPNVPIRCAFNNFRSVFGVPFFANLCYRPKISTYHVENEWHPVVRSLYHGQLSLMCRLARASFTNPFPFANNHPLKVDIQKLTGYAGVGHYELLKLVLRTSNGWQQHKAIYTIEKSRLRMTL